MTQPATQRTAGPNRTSPGKPYASASNAATPIAAIGREALMVLLAALLVLPLAVVAQQMAAPGTRAAGTPWRQGAAVAGGLLLFVPLLYSITKRTGLSARPPIWFVAHVVAGAVGLLLVCVHASAGRLLSMPGVLLALVFFLALQGTLARLFLTPRLSQRFGAQPSSFHTAQGVDRARLSELIAHKRAVLGRLDAQASEALFSPTLRHALRHPSLTWRYAMLSARESRLVGARRQGGALLSLWRRVHIALAAVLLAGVLIHVAVVTFFAGYVAVGRPITWWHLAAWGASP